MNKQQARTLVTQTFTQAFDKGRFQNFIINLLNSYDQTKRIAPNRQMIKDAFKNHVNHYERLGTYTSPDDDIVDILVVHLTKDSKLERARTSIRNFVADHLRTRNNKDAALVAFVSPSEKQWRFSYVKMDYATVINTSGKVGIETKLTPARRFSYIVGEGESCHTAQTRFLDLLQDTTTEPSLAAIEESFSVDAVTKEFFARYSALFGDITHALEKIAAKDMAIREEFKTKIVSMVDFSKKLMGQIVFLYFLQRKGWMGVEKGQDWGTGPRDFLRRLAKGEYGKYDNFFNEVLEPLFYDTLATDRGHEAWCKRFKCRIPFLNGGLFEPICGYDWKNTDIIIPNKLFTNNDPVDEGVFGTGILDVFDRYNFTVNEAEPLEKEVAIDPEMLGKVFENLIEENRRKGLGTFYTPREIVHYMCQESLINYLDTSVNYEHEVVPRADIKMFVNIGEQISHYEAVDAKYAISMPKSIEKNARRIDERLSDITVCDPAVGSGAFPVGMMTEIVRARSTLTPYFNDIKERTPYHFKRRVIQNCIYGVDIDPGAIEIAKLRLWLSLVIDEEDVKQIKPLPNLDYKIVTGNSLMGIERNLFNADLFSELERLKPLFFNETDAKNKILLRNKINALIHKLTNGNRMFDYQIYFSEVFHEKKGFDITIGNPPYVRVDEIPIPQKSLYKEAFRASSGKYDLYYLFFEKGFHLIGNNSTLSFITPNKYCAASSAKILREIIFNNIATGEIVSTSKLRVFERAANYPVISILRKSKHEHQLEVREAFSINRLRDSTSSTYCLNNRQFSTFPKLIIPINVNQNSVNLVLKLLNKNRRLNDFFSVSEGLRIPTKYEQENVSDNKIVKQYQFERWSSISEGAYISNKDLRRVASEKSPRYKKIIENKILIAEDALKLTATIDIDKQIPQGGVYFGVPTSNELDIFVALALLNSNLLSAIYEILFGGMHMGGGYLRYRTQFMEELPIAIPSRDDSSRIILLVKRILKQKENSSDADTSSFERELNNIVYKLYDLLPDEIELVEERIK